MVRRVKWEDARAEIPTVSVVLATHNRSQLVIRAVSSVQAQVYEDWELIVIDDGSTDDTASGVIRLAHGDARIRYFHWANQGLAAARNWGIEVARGAFVTFLDSDDVYKPDHLGRRVAQFAMNPATEMLHGGFEIVGPEGSDKVPDMNDPSKLIPISECIVGGTLFGKVETFRSVGGFRPIYGMDNDLFHRVEAHGCLIEQVTAPTYVYHRDVEDSMCNSRFVDRENVEAEIEIGIEA